MLKNWMVPSLISVMYYFFYLVLVLLLLLFLFRIVFRSKFANSAVESRNDHFKAYTQFAQPTVYIHTYAHTYAMQRHDARSRSQHCEAKFAAWYAFCPIYMYTKVVFLFLFNVLCVRFLFLYSFPQSFLFPLSNAL